MPTVSGQTINPSAADPLDLVEAIVESHEWPFDRSEGELVVSVSGNWCDYHLCFSVLPEINALHVTCAPDLRVAQNRYGEIYELLGRMNERLVLGHFDLWSEDGVPLFRLSQFMPNHSERCLLVAEHLIEIALTECERFYPALQFLLWGGMTPADALDGALLETQGTA
ncbi:MAG: YbjN domain-containing protein [Alphaproteobacteria bacterium]